MSRRTATLVTLAAVAGLAATGDGGPWPRGQGPQPEREFHLRLEPDRNRVVVQVEIETSGPTTAHLLFRGDWQAYPGLEARLRSVKARGRGGALSVESDADDLHSGHRWIRIPEADTVTVEYTLVLMPPPGARTYHRVSQLDGTGGHLLGGDLLPRIWLGPPSSAPHPARIRLEGLPPNWSVATVADRVGLRYAVDDLRDAVLVVGPLRSRRTTIGPRTLTVAIQGNWPAEDDRLIDSVERIAGALHGLARDAWPAGDYLYTAGRSPRSLDGAGAGGQVVDRSALVYVGGGAPGASVIDRWLHTTAHELMHWYIPQAFRFDGPPPAWFAEGFTDYFALKALLAGDLIDGARFLKEIGARLDRYRGSPLYGRESVTDAQEDFWEDDSYRYIYDGGAAAALLLDLGFQARGRSLERAVLAGRGAAPLDVARLIELFTDVPQNDWVRDWLADGVDPDWDGQLARYGLDWEDGRLVSEDDWAIERLASIRP